MQLDKSIEQFIQTYKKNSNDQQGNYKLYSYYWSTICSRIKELINNTQSLSAFFESENLFINYGIIDGVLDEPDKTVARIKSETMDYKHLTTYTFTGWILALLTRINAGDKKELLMQDIEHIGREQKKNDQEIVYLQQIRRQLLVKGLKIDASARDSLLVQQIEKLVDTDFLHYQILQSRRAVAKGAFISVEQRRELVERQKKLQKETGRNETLYSQVKLTDIKKEIAATNTRIMHLFEQSIQYEDEVLKKENEIEKLNQEQSALSPLELENRMVREIEYIRDMTKLSAKRLHMTCCPILNSSLSFFTVKHFASCFDRILEFDPQIFHNARVALFGKPAVLLVPGSGNALFDWKNNQFIVPIIPPGGNAMASIATAAIEYRLDVDEDKKILTSYQKLSNYKTIRSFIALREKLTSDYIKWMTSEYEGYKVLNKEIRQWFEHEIAPHKNEIFCPQELQSFALDKDQYQQMLDDLEKKLKTTDTAKAPPAEALWNASVLLYQRGKFDQAFKTLKEMLSRSPDFSFGYFNLGIIAMKISQKQEAIKAFGEFIKRKPQGWWSGVVQEHLRRLQLQ